MVVKLIRHGMLWVFANLLLVGAISGLLLANLLPEMYEVVKHKLEFPVNEVLMTCFFALAGKEIREAMLPGGSLSDIRKAALPLVATVGGMAGPALLYTAGAALLNPELLRGWAIPTATDIAFSALIARAVFGAKHPAVTFLLLLAIADDAGGLIVLAAFYPTGHTNVGALTGLLAIAVIIALAMRRYGVRKFWWYSIPIAISWFGFYLGGLHPALAAVPLMWTLPHRKHDLGIFSEEKEHHHKREDTLTHMEHFLKVPTEIIVGVFGFVNAGVKLGAIGIGTGLVAGGLIAGKPLGIYLMTKFGQKALKLELPTGMNDRHLMVLGCAAGIGFTVALFVSTQAFPAGITQDATKMGALLSLFSVVPTILAAKLLNIQPTKEEST